MLPPESSRDLLDRGGEAILSALEFLDYEDWLPNQFPTMLLGLYTRRAGPQRCSARTYEKAIARYPGIGIYLDSRCERHCSKVLD